MNDPEAGGSERLAAALRSNEPDALAALFDAYADHLFRYCWFALRNTGVAQIALRDTLVAAAAHAGRLADPSRLPSWLYALARAECRRRGPVPPAEADEPPARPDQPDADSRLMAWNAVTSMDPAEVELLDLACRHNVDVGLVLGASAPQARAMLDRARGNLERALGAEILVSRGSRACPDRAEVLRGWAGSMTPRLRERVLRHCATCPVCGPSLPRNVSAARVFALLPVVTLPADARTRILTFAADPATAPYRDLAIHRSGNLAPDGFPLPSSHHGQRRPRGERQRALAALGATAVAVAVTTAIVLAGTGVIHGPGRGNPAAGGAGAPASGRNGAGAVGAVPVNADPAHGPTTLPPVPRAIATGNMTVFTTLTEPLPGPARQGQGPLPGPPPPRVPGRVVSASSPPASPARGSLLVSPGSIDLSGGSQAQIVLTAVGGQQTWTAGTSSTALLVSGYGGVLQPGQSVTLLVTVNRQGGQGGNGLVYVDQAMPGARTVKVSWSATCPGHPPTPSPAPTPTPAQSSSPAPSASPSPSASSGPSPPSGSPSATAAPSVRPTPRPSGTPSYRHTPPPRPSSPPPSPFRAGSSSPAPSSSAAPLQWNP